MHCCFSPKVKAVEHTHPWEHLLWLRDCSILSYILYLIWSYLIDILIKWDFDDNQGIRYKPICWDTSDVTWNQVWVLNSNSLIYVPTQISIPMQHGQRFYKLMGSLSLTYFFGDIMPFFFTFLFYSAESCWCTYHYHRLGSHLNTFIFCFFCM